MQSAQQYKTLLPSAEEDGFTIRDVAVEEVTLQAVLDMDDFLEKGGLANENVAGFIVFGIDGEVHLVAAGQNRNFTIGRLSKEQFKERMNPTDQNPPRVKQIIQLPTLTIVRGSDCTCTHGGAVINICK